jgi:hypothetical protein
MRKHNIEETHENFFILWDLFEEEHYTVFLTKHENRKKAIAGKVIRIHPYRTDKCLEVIEDELPESYSGSCCYLCAAPQQLAEDIEIRYKESPETHAKKEKEKHDAWVKSWEQEKIDELAREVNRLKQAQIRVDNSELRRESERYADYRSGQNARAFELEKLNDPSSKEYARDRELREAARHRRDCGQE